MLDFIQKRLLKSVEGDCTYDYISSVNTSLSDIENNTLITGGRLCIDLKPPVTNVARIAHYIINVDIQNEKDYRFYLSNRPNATNSRRILEFRQRSVSNELWLQDGDFSARGDWQVNTTGRVTEDDGKELAKMVSQNLYVSKSNPIYVVVENRSGEPIPMADITFTIQVMYVS